MSLIFENFQQYFQIDVIQVQDQKLREAIKNVTEFEELRNLIEMSLNQISKQSFLMMSNSVQTIFELVG